MRRMLSPGHLFTNLDSLWQPFGNSDKYPSMISRHLFSYSVSYLLSGNEGDLKIAEKTVKWLLDHAWDKEYGGWFDSMDENGNPVETTKTTFVQVYAITGLTMYYFITHDSFGSELYRKIEQPAGIKSLGSVCRWILRCYEPGLEYKR